MAPPADEEDEECEEPAPLEGFERQLSSSSMRPTKSNRLATTIGKARTEKRSCTAQTQAEKEAEARLLVKCQPRERDEAVLRILKEGLRNNKFCKALGDEDHQKLCESMDHFSFDGGEDIIKQGDRGSYFFVCQDGQLEVVVNGEATGILGPGAAFGGVALLYNCPRTATVRAKITSSVWGGSGEVFRCILKEHTQKHHAENRQFLDRIKIFDGLESSQKDRVGQIALITEHHQARIRVFSPNEDANAIYAIKSGEATEWKGGTLGPDGELKGGTQVASYSAGDVFGVKAVILSEKRSTYLIVDSACELVVVGVPQLKEVLGENFLAVLESSFVFSVLKRVPLISQAGLSVTQRQKIAEAMKIVDFKASQEVGDDVCLGVVTEGEVCASKAGAPVTLRRGDWWEDELLGGAVRGAPSSAGALKMTGLAAGAAGARIATLRADALAAAMQELGLASVTRDSTEVISHMRKILLAKKVPIFRDLSEEQVDGLVSSLVLKRFTKGALVFQQGEPGVNFFIIAEGEVRVLIDGKLVRTLTKGACFGERALLFDEARTASVEVSTEEADLWSVEKRAFKKVVTETMRQELVHRIELQSANVDLKSLRHVKLIGAGAYGSVRLVEHKVTQKRYALKRVRKSKNDAEGELEVPEEVRQECDLLMSMDHPFILRMVTSLETRDSMYIVTELITGGQLFEQTNERMGVLTRKQAQFYIGSLVCILEAVHDSGIVYRDLKPENVMLDERGFLKLVDFGLAKRLDPQTGRTFTAVGTMLYMAPELVRGRGYGFEVDVWSLGVMFYELVVGQVPFGAEAEDEHELLGAILEGPLSFTSRYNDQQGKKLITGLLNKEPQKRMGCGVNGWEEIKDHKYFKVGVTGNLFSKIIGHDIEAPVVPAAEQYSNERELMESVTLSDSEELYQTTQEDLLKDKVMQTFKKFDSNGDGKIDRSELQKLLHMLDAQTFSDENTEKLLNAVDKNGDGLIQFEEFLSWVVGDNSLGQELRKFVDHLDMHS